jgi:hypothetical protein
MVELLISIKIEKIFFLVDQRFDHLSITPLAVHLNQVRQSLYKCTVLYFDAISKGWMQQNAEERSGFLKETPF